MEGKLTTDIRGPATVVASVAFAEVDCKEQSLSKGQEATHIDLFVKPKKNTHDDSVVTAQEITRYLSFLIRVKLSSQNTEPIIINGIIRLARVALKVISNGGTRSRVSR